MYASEPRFLNGSLYNPDHLHLDRFALIRWGGQTQGQRPRTALARIDAVHKGAQYIRVTVWLNGRGRWAKKPRNIPVSDICQTWRVCPSMPDLRAARKLLRREP